MRDYGVVAPTFWTGATGKSLRGDHESQVLALYLMTCPHANMIGIFHCPTVYMAHETGLTLEGATKALARLSKGGFCEYDEPLEVVYVRRMARYQIGEQLKPGDNRVKAVVKQLNSVAVDRFAIEFAQDYGDSFNLPLEELTASPCEAPSKPLRSQEQDQEQDQEQEQEQEGAKKIRPARYQQEHMETATAILDQLQATFPAIKSTKTKREAGANEIRKMVDLDGRPLDEIAKVFYWAHNDTATRGDWVGWAANIQSITKLRKHYDKLKAGMLAEQNPTVGKVNQHIDQIRRDGERLRQLELEGSNARLS